MLTKEKLDSWFEPRKLIIKSEDFDGLEFKIKINIENLTEKEEIASEEECDTFDDEKCHDCQKVSCMCYENSREV